MASSSLDYETYMKRDLRVFSPAAKQMYSEETETMYAYHEDHNQRYPHVNSVYDTENTFHLMDSSSSREDSAFEVPDKTLSREDTSLGANSKTSFREDSSFITDGITSFREDSSYKATDKTTSQNGAPFHATNKTSFREDSSTLTTEKKLHTTDHEKQKAPTPVIFVTRTDPETQAVPEEPREHQFSAQESNLDMSSLSLENEFTAPTFSDHLKNSSFRHPGTRERSVTNTSYSETNTAYSNSFSTRYVLKSQTPAKHYGNIEERHLEFKPKENIETKTEFRVRRILTFFYLTVNDRSMFPTTPAILEPLKHHLSAFIV